MEKLKEKQERKKNKKERTESCQHPQTAATPKVTAYHRWRECKDQGSDKRRAGHGNQWQECNRRFRKH